mgnify:CR=1 FL=1
MSADIIPLPRKAPTLDPMLSLTAGGMNSVNAVILDRMQSEIPLIPRLAGHLISGGGKRLRPMLTLACADLVGYAGSRHYKLAASVEFIHTATLLHDDVVDGSGLRRGRKTANIIWGNSASVLTNAPFSRPQTRKPRLTATTSPSRARQPFMPPPCVAADNQKQAL